MMGMETQVAIDRSDLRKGWENLIAAKGPSGARYYLAVIASGLHRRGVHMQRDHHAVLRAIVRAWA